MHGLLGVVVVPMICVFLPSDLRSFFDLRDLFSFFLHKGNI